MCSPARNVRFVPIADIAPRYSTTHSVILLGAITLARRPAEQNAGGSKQKAEDSRSSLASSTAMPGLVIGGLFAGTLIVGILIGLYRPGFAERTELSAVAGWCLLCASVAVRVQRSAIVRVATGAALFVIVIGSASTLYALYAGAGKDHWRDIFADLERALPLGYPVAIMHPYTEALAQVYAPQAMEENHIYIFDSNDLANFPPPGAKQPDALWLVYLVLPGVDQVGAHLEQRGYQRVLHTDYSKDSPNFIYVDLYALPGTPAFRDLEINGGFAGNSVQAKDWYLPPGHAALEPGAGGSRVLVLTNAVQAESGAFTLAPGSPHKTYRLAFDAQSQLTSGQMRSFLICADAEGTILQVGPNSRGADEPADGAWHSVFASVNCPEGTQTIKVDLRNVGMGVVRFRDVRLQTLNLPDR